MILSFPDFLEQFVFLTSTPPGFAPGKNERQFFADRKEFWRETRFLPFSPYPPLFTTTRASLYLVYNSHDLCEHARGRVLPCVTTWMTPPRRGWNDSLDLLTFLAAMKVCYYWSGTRTLPVRFTDAVPRACQRLSCWYIIARWEYCRDVMLFCRFSSFFSFSFCFIGNFLLIFVLGKRGEWLGRKRVSVSLDLN